MSSDKESDGSNEVSEVMSPQVSQETMGPATVTDLPRYHSLAEDFGRLADRWMAALQYAPVTQLHTDVLGEIRVGFDQLSGKG